MLSTTNKWQPILLVDTNNMAWKNFYAMRKTALSAGDIKTGMLYGVFRDIVTLCDEFQTSEIVWCFDMKSTKRKAIYPDYKGNRKPQSPKEEAMRAEAYKQIDHLQTILSSLGFRNVLSLPGYEADDMVAAAVRACRKMGCSDRSKFIVSRDADLYQLLRKNIIAHDMTKKSFLTCDGFRKKYGIGPKRWAMVKAIAGCSGDNVPGIQGVGELTAVRFLLGALPTTGKQSAVIRERIEAGAKQIALNYELVKLPFRGCPEVELTGNELSSQRWVKVMKSLRMDSMIRKYPF